MGQKLQTDGHFTVIEPTIDFVGTIRNVAYDTNYVNSHDGIKCLHLGGYFINGVETHGIDCLATNVNLNGINEITSSGFIAVQTITGFTRT